MLRRVLQLGLTGGSLAKKEAPERKKEAPHEILEAPHEILEALF